MRLSELLKAASPSIPLSGSDRDIRMLSVDSREVEPGGLFIAVRGAEAHGEDFVQDAVAKGACAVITSQSWQGQLDNPDVTHIRVDDPVRLVQPLAERFYAGPARSVKVVGVTGTNGKTTVTYLLESVMTAAGHTAGVMGTVNYRVGQDSIPCKNTTPGVVACQKYLAWMREQGARYCFMEVSSHALHQKRVEGIPFHAGIFTNLTQDHLDYHRDMENYFAAKAILFDSLEAGAKAVVNVDDAYGRRLVAKTKAEVIRYGIAAEADVKAADVALSLDGTVFQLSSDFGSGQIRSRLIGRHNVANILAAAAFALAEGLDIKTLQRGIEAVDSIPGRLEQVACDRPFHVFVDYAHTEDALDNVLSNLKNISPVPLTVVFGCGGDRDKGKRARMGAVADRWADRIILTNDNPRSEDPRSIVDQIKAGIQTKPCRVILDRRRAIAQALSQASEGEVILVAGKGHEDYQIFADHRIHFDDREEIRKVLECSV